MLILLLVTVLLDCNDTMNKFEWLPIKGCGIYFIYESSSLNLQDKHLQTQRAFNKQGFNYLHLLAVLYNDIIIILIANIQLRIFEWLVVYISRPIASHILCMYTCMYVTALPLSKTRHI